MPTASGLPRSLPPPSPCMKWLLVSFKRNCRSGRIFSVTRQCLNGTVYSGTEENENSRILNFVKNPKIRYSRKYKYNYIYLYKYKSRISPYLHYIVFAGLCYMVWCWTNVYESGPASNHLIKLKLSCSKKYICKLKTQDYSQDFFMLIKAVNQRCDVYSQVFTDTGCWFYIVLMLPNIAEMWSNKE